VLLVIGWVLIKRRRERAHKWVMLAAFDVSVLFLICYLWYHCTVGHVKFTHPGAVRIAYYSILASHVVLAMTVPFLAATSIYLGLRATGCCGVADEVRQQQLELAYRTKHRKLARWTFPIWLYVSVTGVVVYVMLYHLWPPMAE